MNRDGSLFNIIYIMRYTRYHNPHWHPAWSGSKAGRDRKLYGPNGLHITAEYLRQWRDIVRCAWRSQGKDQ
jgi:hypothetical protein